MNECLEPPLVTHPVIVIGIPCFNEAKWLDRTIASVKAQTWTDFAVLIVDNASTDATQSIAKAHAAADPRFRYYRQPQNIGAAANFNFVRDRSDSPYIFWLGAHDLLHPQFLEKHLNALRRNPQASLSQSTHAWIDEQDAQIETVRDRPLAWGNPNSVWRYLGSVRANLHNIGINSVIRRSALEGVGFTTVIGTDRIILSRLAFRGPLSDFDEILYFRRSFSSDREGWAGYMKRLTGQETAGPAENWDAMAQAYDADLRALVGHRPMQQLYRAILQLLLRYYLPVGLGSKRTTALWTLRRIINIRSIAARRLSRPTRL